MSFNPVRDTWREQGCGGVPPCALLDIYSAARATLLALTQTGEPAPRYRSVSV